MYVKGYAARAEAELQQIFGTILALMDKHRRDEDVLPQDER